MAEFLVISLFLLVLFTTFFLGKTMDESKARRLQRTSHVYSMLDDGKKFVIVTAKMAPFFFSRVYIKVTV